MEVVALLDDRPRLRIVLQSHEFFHYWIGGNDRLAIKRCCQGSVRLVVEEVHVRCSISNPVDLRPVERELFGGGCGRMVL